VQYGVVEQQVIAICSKKLTPSAIKWSKIQKEEYGIFYSTNKFDYYLRGKPFTIADHNYLLWMEASEVPMIVRWRIYLQSFDFKICHIKGRDNTVADALSRLLMLVTVYDELEYPEADHTVNYILNEGACSQDQVNLLAGVFDDESKDEILTPRYPKKQTAVQLFHEVHNGQQGHMVLKCHCHV
jgi:hypothetical protein